MALEAAAAPSAGGSAGDLAGSGGASSGLLGTLRGAAAAAAAEEAAERQQGRGGWLARLLPGRGSAGGGGEAAEGLHASVEAARSRLSRLVAPSAAVDSYRAGYANLPASRGTSPPTGRGLPSAGRPPRPGGASASGGDLLSSSPGLQPAVGGLKAARAAYLARGSGRGVGAASGGGVRRGSVDVESPGSASS